MMTRKPTWTTHPDNRGLTATSGNRVVEVLRAYQNDWRVFATIDSQVCKAMPGEPKSFATSSEAKTYAGRILSGELTPETWPITVS